MKNIKAVLLTFFICLLVSCNSIKKQSAFNNVHFEIEQVKIDDIKTQNNFELVENKKEKKDTCKDAVASIIQVKKFKKKNKKHRQFAKTGKVIDNLSFPVANTKTVKFYSSTLKEKDMSPEELIIFALSSLLLLAIIISSLLLLIFRVYLIAGILGGISILFFIYLYNKYKGK